MNKKRLQEDIELIEEMIGKKLTKKEAEIMKREIKCLDKILKQKGFLR